MTVIRNFRPDDLVPYTRLVNEIDTADGLGRATSLECMGQRLVRPGCCPEEDVFFAERDGLLVGYAEIVRELEIGRVVLDGAVHPAHRGKGVGGSMLEVALSRIRGLGAEVVHIPVSQRMPAAQAFLHKRGFRVVRRHLQMSLAGYKGAPPQPPQGFEIRHFGPDDAEGLCLLQNLAFAGSWGFRPNTVDEVRYIVNASPCHPEGVLFITEGDRLASYCWTADDPVEKGKGCIRMMGVDPSYRGRGLGRSILVAGMDYLKGCGKTTIELTVDSRNTRAKNLYRSVGFKRKGTILWYQMDLG